MVLRQRGASLDRPERTRLGGVLRVLFTLLIAVGVFLALIYVMLALPNRPGAVEAGLALLLAIAASTAYWRRSRRGHERAS